MTDIPLTDTDGHRVGTCSSITRSRDGTLTATFLLYPGQTPAELRMPLDVRSISLAHCAVEGGPGPCALSPHHWGPHVFEPAPAAPEHHQ